VVQAAEAPAAGSAFFENRVRPILVEHCYECHSEEAGKQKGGLLLDRANGWLEGGDSGPAVVPGSIKDSLLALAVSHTDEDYMMPEEKLPEGKINVLLRWIQMGAPGPRKDLGESEFSQLGDQVYLSGKAKTHWSFQPVKKTAPPQVKGAGKNPVDQFVGKRLRDAGLDFSPPADRRIILRRLSYDLTGLPPTYAEVESFVKDERPDAYVRQVDRLLSSPHFGERWGRYWLDIARYADTREWQAAGRDSRYPFAFTYRDYVIRAYNEDLPYDQFLREQIAADIYADRDDAPELAALGFLTVGSRFRNDRDEIANDRIDVVTRGVMGLTVTCARCHDHKFDPIPTTDYYAMHGIFRSIEDLDDYPVIDRGRNLDPELVADYEKQRAAAVADKRAYMKELAEEARADFRNKPREYMGGLHDLSISRSADVRKLTSGGALKETVLTPVGRNILRVPKEKKFKEDPFWAPFAFLIPTPEQKFAGSFQQGMEVARKADPGTVNPALLAALERKPAIKTKKQFMERYGEVIAGALKANKDGKASPPHKEILAALDDPSGIFAITPEAALSASQIQGRGRTALARKDNAIANIDAEHPGAPERAMVVAEAEAPWKAYVYERGEANNRGESVQRRFLTSLGGEKAFPGNTSGRKELAEAITDSNNQFTTRAYVNRTWMHLFGEPLVKTPGDFGLQSEPPTHPELLDWLAATFVEEGWSTKKLIRRIALSRTYRQQSAERPEAVQVDPENQLLWRANLRRLDFEAMRDGILAVSGSLDRTMGGRAVDITVPPFPPRRTVYAFIDRVNLDDIFATFDFPSPAQTAPERPETMVPQQALFGMNDPFAVKQARTLAGGLDTITTGNVRQGRIAELYRRVFQRNPSPAELKVANSFLDDATEGAAPGSESAWQYGFGAPDPNLPAAERFKPFPFWDPKKQAYQISKVYPHPKMKFIDVSAVGGHPGANQSVASVRRWTAPYAGKFRITGEIQHMRENGDGIRARIISDRQGLLRNTIAFNETKGINEASVELEEGEILDFTVDCNKGGPNSDAFRWTITITRLPSKDPGDYPPADLRTNWDSQADFGPPPPPPPNQWQQLAHALLLTNEFLFVD
jgi:hypothetical protein